MTSLAPELSAHFNIAPEFMALVILADTAFIILIKKFIMETIKEKEFNIDKFKNFSEWYSKVLEKAEIVDDRYSVKGFHINLSWGMFIIDKIYSIWESELENKNHKKVLFPAVIPEENFEKEKEHVEGFKPEVFWICEAGNNKLERRLSLRPTSETAFYQMYSLWIRSYKDLPLKLYQSCSVFRYETKATKPLIRAREFLWIESHCSFKTKEEALSQVLEDMEITKRVYDKLGIPFLFFKRPEWDKFKGSVFTFAADTMLPDKKRLQLPSTHYLGENFAKAFNIKFEDGDGNKKWVHQTCYGPPISRTLATIISIFGDNKGLRLPFDLAPIQIIIIPILKKGEEEKILNYCNKIKEKLSKYGVELDKTEKTPGEKFNIWELKGVPIRIEIGSREVKNNEVTISRRDRGGRLRLKVGELNKIEEIGKEITENLKKEAREWFNGRITSAKNLDELKKKIKLGFVKIPFCSRDEIGKECAEKIKEICEIAGTLYSEEPSPNGERCIVCGKEAKVYVYACKSY